MSITWIEAAHLASAAAAEQGEWCGAPLPVDDYELVVAPTYGFQKLNGFKLKESVVDVAKRECPEILEIVQEVLEPEHINSWWCPARGGWVHIFRENGRIQHWVDVEYAKQYADRVERILCGAQISQVQDPLAEITAIQKLGSLVKPHLWAMYVLHGLILETSPKSGVTYVIRKSRPTLALRPDPKTGMMRTLTALCLHPIGYYDQTHIGCMVPTDEVIAHLILIRTREAFFWRKANHHPPYTWQAGI